MHHWAVFFLRAVEAKKMEIQQSKMMLQFPLLQLETEILIMRQVTLAEVEHHQVHILFQPQSNLQEWHIE